MNHNVDTDDISPISGYSEAYDDNDAPGEMLEMPLDKVPRRTPLMVAPKETVAAVIEQMNANSCGCVLVVEDGALVGIFTERDVLKQSGGRHRDLHATPVSEFMTRDPDTLPNDATVAYALNRMSEEGYRHVPLLDDDGSPVGVVGMRDIISWMVDLFPARILNIPAAPKSFPSAAEGA